MVNQADFRQRKSTLDQINIVKELMEKSYKLNGIMENI